MDDYELKNLDEICGEGHIAGHEEDDASQEAVQTPQTEEKIMKPATFKEGCFGMRGDIELLKSKAANWMMHPELINLPINGLLGKRQEMCANLMLAYRHLEDARMRIGKAIQAYDGGKSAYPK